MKILSVGGENDERPEERSSKEKDEAVCEELIGSETRFLVAVLIVGDDH